MKLVKAKTCSNCVARNMDGSCEFGFDVQKKWVESGVRTSSVPKEPCFKVITISSYLEVRDYLSKQKNSK